MEEKYEVLVFCKRNTVKLYHFTNGEIWASLQPDTNSLYTNIKMDDLDDSKKTWLIEYFMEWRETIEGMLRDFPEFGKYEYYVLRVHEKEGDVEIVLEELQPMSFDNNVLLN